MIAFPQKNRSCFSYDFGASLTDYLCISLGLGIKTCDGKLSIMLLPKGKIILRLLEVGII